MHDYQKAYYYYVNKTYTKSIIKIIQCFEPLGVVSRDEIVDVTKRVDKSVHPYLHHQKISDFLTTLSIYLFII